jgi:hypothetical protein
VVPEGREAVLMFSAGQLTVRLTILVVDWIPAGQSSATSTVNMWIPISETPGVPEITPEPAIDKLGGRGPSKWKKVYGGWPPEACKLKE